MSLKRSIVLIDDDETTNFLNKIIIEQTELVDEILTFESGQAALDFFNENPRSDQVLILLDINMPVMDGWQFLAAYSRLEKKGSDPNIVMLSSSIDPGDMKKAEEQANVKDFQSKPLSADMLQALVDKYLN